MKGLLDLLRWTAAHLDETQTPWALVGGWAVSIRTEPRFTRDVDIAVAAHTDADAEALTSSFTSQRFTIDALIEQDAAHRLATVRLRPPHDYENGLLLDILFASSGIEREICSEAERLECLPGFRAPVAKVEHLLALKILARDDETRPQDAADIRALMETGDEEVILRARGLLRLITERGYHRGRDIVRDLDMLRRP